MLTRNRISLLLAVTLVASLLVVIATTLSRGQTSVSANQKIKVLRRKDELKLKPTAAEIASLKKQLPKEERQLEVKLPTYLPIKVKLRAEKEKAFKDIDNDSWIRDLEVEVKNTGTKPIYYLVILINMPELKFGQSNMLFSLRYGDKKFRNFASGAKPEDLSLKPGETCILKILDAVDWKEYSRDMSWPKPKQLVLKFQEISFGDGTGFRSSYDGPWPPPPKQPGMGACLQDPGSYAGVAKSDTAPFGYDDKRASKFSSGGKPASFLPAKFSYASSLLFLGSLKANLAPGDSCCTGDSCYWIREYEDETACYDTGTACDSIHRAEYLNCNDSRGHWRPMWSGISDV